MSDTLIPTIKDTPLPALGGGDITFNVPSDTADGITPVSITNTPIPTNQPATDVISTAINTQTKTILGNFTFESLGAISIGQYKQGVQGNIKISPNGIVGLNSSGITTFSIDGTTGNATFSGEIVGGSIVIGSGNNVFSVDTNGNMWLGNASLSSAPFKVDNAGNITMRSWTLKTPDGSVSIVGTNSGAAGGGGGIVFPNLTGTFFQTSGGSLEGGLYMSGSNEMNLANTAGNVNIFSGSINTAIFDTAGALIVFGDFAAGGVKSAVVKTHDGYRKLYALEAPDVWFFDVVEKDEKIDPMFLSVTDGDIKRLTFDDGSILIMRKRKGFPSSKYRFKKVSMFRKLGERL